MFPLLSSLEFKPINEMPNLVQYINDNTLLLCFHEIRNNCYRPKNNYSSFIHSPTSINSTFTQFSSENTSLSINIEEFKKEKNNQIILISALCSGVFLLVFCALIIIVSIIRRKKKTKTSSDVEMKLEEIYITPDSTAVLYDNPLWNTSLNACTDDPFKNDFIDEESIELCGVIDRPDHDE